jgi:dihydroorotate dehydrogenase
MRFFYSSGAMGYDGKGYALRDQGRNFPILPFVTKTLTRRPRKGNPWAVLHIGKSVYNKVSLDNMGFFVWMRDVYYENKIKQMDTTISIAGYDHEIAEMVDYLDRLLLGGIELNFSCPNVKDFENRMIPKTNRNLYLKLNYKQDPHKYDLTNVKGIRLNSIPLKFCGGSGKIAQKKNWEFIRKFNKEGLNVAGCSWTSLKDLKRLEDMGCQEIGIGSIIITKPKLVEKLNG